MKRVTCDTGGCPARAVGLVRMEAGSLAFCGHHMRRYGPKLEPLTLEVVPIVEVPDTPPEEPPERHPYRDAVDGMKDR